MGKSMSDICNCNKPEVLIILISQQTLIGFLSGKQLTVSLWCKKGVGATSQLI